MKVAVIVVVYNDAEEAVTYINKISKYDCLNRIIVVDNKSPEEGVLEKLKQTESEKVTVIQSDKNGGYNYGNNYGINYIKNNNEDYDFYIISNPDIDISEDAVKHTLGIINEDKEIGIIAPRMFNSQDKPIRRSAWRVRTPKLDMIHSTRLLEILFYSKLRAGEYSNEELEKERLQVDCIAGAYFIIRKNVYETIGGFDDNVFLFYEEDILSKKVKALNYKIVSLNTEKFNHYESQTIGKALTYYQKMTQLFKSKMYYHKKYNNINIFEEIIFYILRFFRIIELIIEIPVRKLLKK